jgi:hypothetical protein
MSQNLTAKGANQLVRSHSSSMSDTRRSAMRIVASTFGVFAGIGGLTHGIGEMLQGNVPAGGLMIASWTQGPIAAHMGGDPALTVVPNVFVTGLLATVVSLATIAWAAAFVQRRHGGTVLILLSVTMLLVGGGAGPPIIGILAGIAGTLIHARLTWWRAHLSGKIAHLLAGLWPWVFGLALLNGAFLFVGATVLVYAFGWGNENLYLNSFFLTVAFVVLAIITGIAHDLAPHERGYALEQAR